MACISDHHRVLSRGKRGCRWSACRLICTQVTVCVQGDRKADPSILRIRGAFHTAQSVHWWMTWYTIQKNAGGHECIIGADTLTGFHLIFHSELRHTICVDPEMRESRFLLQCRSATSASMGDCNSHQHCNKQMSFHISLR